MKYVVSMHLFVSKQVKTHGCQILKIHLMRNLSGSPNKGWIGMKKRRRKSEFRQECKNLSTIENQNKLAAHQRRIDNAKKKKAWTSKALLALKHQRENKDDNVSYLFIVKGIISQCRQAKFHFFQKMIIMLIKIYFYFH